MNKTFFKNLIRDIRKTLSRFLSIVVIIALGVAFYAGVRAASPDMKKSGDYYFNKNNLMDFKVISTLGLTKDDVDEVKKIDGITNAEGSYSLDAVIEKDNHTLVLNINSLPEVNGINSLLLEEGRMPENDKEAIVEARFLKDNKFKIGDKISLESGNDSNIEERLKNTDFEIVGTAQSPLYVSAQRQLSSVGNGTVRGFVYILPQVFKNEVFTEIYVRTNNEQSRNSLLNNDNYKEYSSIVEKSLKDISVARNEIRFAEVLKSAKDKIKEAENKLNLARLKLQTAENELEENTAKLNSEEEKAFEQIQEGEAKIEESKDKLMEIKKPEWYILGRFTNVGYETYRQDSDRIDNIGKAFPLIFFLVAALVSLTTMTRMVQEKRIEIGIFKALGYSRTAIVSHYLIYSLAASLVGSLVGISIGFKLFPPLIMNAYGSLYTIPETITIFDKNLAIQASAIAIFFTTVASIAATLEELKEVPASLLRPKPPKSGKRIILEKIGFIWKRLSFTRKVTARNIFRYKQRFFMTVIGIAACTGLMITGYGIKVGIKQALERQFNKIYKYDMTASINKTMNENESKEMKSRVIETSGISSILLTYSKNSSVEKVNSTGEDAHILVPEDKNELNKYINLNKNSKTLRLQDDGVIITEKLSKLIDKGAGETIHITVNDKAVDLKISAVTEHYVQHFIYMSQTTYEKITGEKPEFNGFYGLLSDSSEDTQNELSKKLTAINGIASVSFKNIAHFDLNKSMNSINSVVIVLIASAGVLAFVVIYNLTNININERRRELATIKLLGFFNKELAFYVYRENIILTIIGSLLGIILGIVLNNFVINTTETNVMLFVRRIDPIYFLYSVLFTMTFSAIVNIAMYRSFDKIDMIESLKSAE